MTSPTVSRRSLLRYSGAVLAGLSVLRLAGPARAFQDASGGEVIPWLDQPDDNPVPEMIVRQLKWEQPDTWLTPPDPVLAGKTTYWESNGQITRRIRIA
jgi:hypothetical protein